MGLGKVYCNYSFHSKIFVLFHEDQYGKKFGTMTGKTYCFVRDNLKI